MDQNSIPSFAQSSVNPAEVSLTIESLGKTVAGLVVFAGMIWGVDPAIASQQWGVFVASIATAVPAGYAVWHSGLIVYGILRKAAVRIFAK